MRVLAPKEISRPSRRFVSGIQIETNLLREFPVSRVTGIPQPQHRPGTHPRLDRPTTHGPKLHVWITLVLVTENTDFAFGDFHQFHKSDRLTMAVLHRHNIGTSHKLLESGDGDRNPMQLRVVVDRDAKLGKSVGEIEIKLHRIIRRRRKIKGTPQSTPSAPACCANSTCSMVSRVLRLVQPIKTGTRFFATPMVASMSFFFSFQSSV